ncbi:MAG: Smr/MutS family protein [Chitinophagales bacterium]|nr:Smr/MutS family protein [Chitinophagales bacterium]MDW8427586.1 Smr/MutS family protein [Chitinophagales bacterium]
MAVFRIHDRVVLRKSGIEGQVCAVDKSDFYLIQTEKGRQWVRAEELQHAGHPEQEPPVHTLHQSALKNRLYLALCFSPTDWSRFDSILLNCTEQHFRFSYELLVSDNKLFELKEKVVGPHENFFVHTIEADLLNERANLRLTFYNQQLFSGAHEVPIKLRPQSVFSGADFISLLNKHGKLIRIKLPEATAYEPLILTSQFLQTKNPTVVTSHFVKPGGPLSHDVMTVDLHADKLPVSTEGLKSHEILNEQLSYALKQLQHALAAGYRQVVFVHGIGAGALRTRLQQLLTENGFTDFTDDWHPKHGYGATVVTLP